MKDKKQDIGIKLYLAYVARYAIITAIVLAIVIPIILIATPKSYAWGDIDPDRVIDGGQISDDINATGEDGTLVSMYLWNYSLQAQLGDYYKPVRVYFNNGNYSGTSATRPAFTPDSGSNSKSYRMIVRSTGLSGAVSNNTANYIINVPAGFSDYSYCTVYVNPSATTRPNGTGWDKFAQYFQATLSTDDTTYEAVVYFRYGTSAWEVMETTTKDISTIPGDCEFAIGYKKVGTTPVDPDIPNNPDNPDDSNPTQQYRVQITLYGNGGTINGKLSESIYLNTTIDYTYILPSYINSQNYFTLVRDGYTFKYWSSSYDGSTGAVDFSQQMRGNITLYAIYERDIIPSNPNTNDVIKWQALLGASLSAVTGWLNVLDVTIFGLNIRNALISIFTITIGISVLFIILRKMLK